jgi:hypothetical protein
VHSQRLRARQATRIDSDSKANRWERLQTQEKQNVPHQKHLGAIPKFDYRHRIGQIGVSHQFTSSLVQPPLILWTYLQKSCHRLPFTSHRFTAEEPDTHRSSYHLSSITWPPPEPLPGRILPCSVTRRQHLPTSPCRAPAHLKQPVGTPEKTAKLSNVQAKDVCGCNNVSS